MPDDLDPTTARLVSELSAMILPGLTKSLSNALPAVDLSGAIERTNRTAQDLRSEIVKALRTSADDSRAGRSIIMQSIGNVLEEISSLRKSLDRLPDTLLSAVSNIAPQETKLYDNEPVMNELNEISERIDALTQGIKAFFETYAQNRENDSSLHETLRPSIDADALSGIEGLIKAEGKTHSTALAEMSREISVMIEENNTALLHEVREAVTEELSGLADGGQEPRKTHGESNRLIKFTALLSGASIILILINIIILLTR